MCEVNKMLRTRAERRHKDIIKALRKRNITRTWQAGGLDWEYYDNLHQYSKNKIHCSCPYCSIKTKNNFYGPSKIYKKSDLVKLERLNYEITLWQKN